MTYNLLIPDNFVAQKTQTYAGENFILTKANKG